MKIAFTTKAPGWDGEMDPRFGRTAFLSIYNNETEQLETIDNSSVAEHQHGAGPMTAQILSNKGVQVLITGNSPGGNAAQVLEVAGIRVVSGANEMTVRDVLKAFIEGSLS